MRSRYFKIFSCIAFILSLFSCAHADDLAGRLDSYLKAWYDAGQFNGSALVAKGGDIILAKGYGMADMAWDVPNSPETRFDIGSISKQFTTVLVFQLCAAGKIRLDATILEYLSEYREDTGKKVTVDHLLQHTSGIPCYLRDQERLSAGLPSYDIGQKHNSREMIEKYLSRDLLFEPGSRYRYSNSGFYLLKEIIERVTGKSLEENLNERILGPLALNDTGIIQQRRINPRMAAGHQRIGQHYGLCAYEYIANLYGAGGMYSTVIDLFKWNRAIRDGSVLPPEWQDKMFAIYKKEGPNSYAYSQTLLEVRLPNFDKPVKFYSFNGATTGFISDALYYPETGHTIVLLDNSEEYNHWQIAPGLYSISMGGTADLPNPSAGDKIAEFALDSSLDEVRAEYGRLTSRENGLWDFRAVESEVNTYAYRLLDQARFRQAQKLFELNTLLFPASANAANSYAEYYFRTGNEEMAGKFYSLEKRLKERESMLADLLRNGQFDRLKTEIAKIRNTEKNSILLEDRIAGPVFGEAMGSGDMEKAIAIAQVWILANPASAGPHFSLAAAYSRSGKIEDAERVYRQIIEKFPGTRYQKTAEARLSELSEKK
jgi:CubicO group peptidase (beta-lactamase class C family)